MQNFLHVALYAYKGKIADDEGKMTNRGDENPFMKAFSSLQYCLHQTNRHEGKMGVIKMP